MKGKKSPQCLKKKSRASVDPKKSFRRFLSVVFLNFFVSKDIDVKRPRVNVITISDSGVVVVGLVVVVVVVGLVVVVVVVAVAVLVAVSVVFFTVYGSLVFQYILVF